MRILASIPVIFMVVLGLYAVWDLVITGFNPPVPADQLAPKNAEIQAVMEPLRQDLQTKMSGQVVPQIDASLQTIADEYGESSVEYNQALIEAALMLHVSTRADLADDYMSRAVKVSREVFGTEHRETALALNDLANLVTIAKKADYTDESISYLEEALVIREKVLSDNHPELTVNKVNLADQLFLRWKETGTNDDLQGLETSAELLEEVMALHQAQGDEVNEMDRVSVKLLYARISFYLKDFATAAENFEATLLPVSPDTDPLTYMVFSNSYAEYITALKETGETEKAESMRADIVRYLEEASAAEQAQQQADSSLEE